MLDDNDMIRVLASFVNFPSLFSQLSGSFEQDRVGSDHIIHNRRLGDLLGPELPLGTEVLSIIVSEMVVGRDRKWLDTGINQEFSQDGFNLGLTRLEIVSTDEGLVLLGELDSTGDKGVLGSTIDVGTTFEDGSHGKDGRRSDFFVGRLDGSEEVFGSVVDSGDDLGVSFSVGSPENNDIVELVVGLEVSDIGSDVVEMGLLVVTGDEVIGSIGLVSGDEVGV